MVTSSPTRMPPVQHGVPGQAEVFAVDLGGSREPETGVSPRIFAPRGGSFDREHHVAGDMNSQIARLGQFSIAPADYTCRSEGKQRELLHVEEVGALEMSVPLRIARADGGGLDRGLNIRVDHVGFIQTENALNAGQLPLYVGDHHVCFTLNSAAE